MSGGLDLRLSLAREAFALEVDLALPAGGVTVLFGPSGCGKTTLLRCVAGLEPAARGHVRVAGATWHDDAAGVRLPAWRRPLGYVFQEASLFDHLTVARNLAYGQRRSGAGNAATARALDDAVALLGIGHLLERRPAQLSGGERQRVAIARALATQPRLLLMDEPLAAIDAARKQEILPWLERLRDELRIPMLYVTHSADEMARLADTLVLMRDGRAETCGPLGKVLSRLDTAVARADDAGVVLPGRIAAIDARWHLARADIPGGVLWLDAGGLALGQAVRLRLLARDASIATAPPPAGTHSIQNLLSGTVRAIGATPHPSQAVVQVDCAGSLVLARITARAVDQLGLAPGQAVWVQVKSVAVAR